MLKLTRTNTIAMPVRIRLPTDKPNVFNEGTITCQVKIKSKDEIRQIVEAEISDADLVRELVQDVSGLGDADGNPLQGDAAIEEIISGPWSSYLTVGIIQTYFEQYGEARVKNSRPSRGR